MDWLLARASSEIGLLLAVTGAALVIGLPIVLWRKRRLGWTKAAWITSVEAAMIGSLLFIGVLTLGSFGVGGHGQFNVVPFGSLIESLDQGEFYVQLTVFDIIANAALFIPLGMAIGLRFPRMKIGVCLAALVAVAGSIEVVQGALLARSGDITDVITNTAGGFAGYLVAQILYRGWPYRRQTG